MSRLYIKVDSDRRQHTIGIGANRDALIYVNYGTANDSKKLVEIRIGYPYITKEEVAEGLVSIPYVYVNGKLMNED